MDSIIQQHIDT